MGEIPIKADVTALGDNSEACVSIAKEDWDSLETSRDFKMPDLFIHLRPTLGDSHSVALRLAKDRIARLKLLEEENNRLAIRAYGLEGDSLYPEVPDEQITLYRPDRTEDMKRLVSYAIGCVMGRYSLDIPGLVYAHSGNHGFDPTQYTTFRADDDGIIPLLDSDWGIRDDAPIVFSSSSA